ncbi:phospholipid carrier-dependent glycosyltransferase [Leucobacter sp. UT-8R-CII-1-4]|uniref:phospholipid carrier-dependent glycosyltransferase n=1 Tax=Leucobacter sp. UT-8R-CII-1-4 TaxID=3040075 RepID=UPI0024A93332|nr:phospholipid carrier-dependent glycosyltransferase [Leucobacter sp. UT-8R-CII-1-4]MDI6023932.1 phospholipid carrier-dependent glycosyltransferase [Leucobacter sp. UT-8R-CII-1-4]
MSFAKQHLRWIAPLAILAVAAWLRLWSLDKPGTLVFDELYYVRDAVTQLVYGYPTVWTEFGPEFSGELARAFLDQASSIAHPPLGKWLIGLGLLFFGPESAWGWRVAVASAGVLTVALTMRLGWLLSRSRWVAYLAGFLLALDGVHIVLTRVALLDGFLTLFVVLGAIFVVRDWQQSAGLQGGLHWRRPWLLAAGLTFGAAAAVKWSGLYPFAAFLVLLTLGDLLRRINRARLLRARGIVQSSWRAVLSAMRQGLATALIALPAAALAYVASWTGWIVNPGGQNRHEGEPWWESLWHWHVDAFAWHSTLDVQHPYQANPLGWPLGLRPTAMYSERVDGYVSAISPLPNVFITWGGVIALLLLLWVVLGRTVFAVRGRIVSPLLGSTVAASAFVLTGYLSGWLPWVLTPSRPAVYQFYSVVMTPFAALALALVLVAFARFDSRVLTGTLLGRVDDQQALQSRRIAVLLLLVLTLILSLLFWPVWSGIPIPEWFYRAHRWLPGWV